GAALCLRERDLGRGRGEHRALARAALARAVLDAHGDVPCLRRSLARARGHVAALAEREPGRRAGLARERDGDEREPGLIEERGERGAGILACLGGERSQEVLGGRVLPRELLHVALHAALEWLLADP